MIPPNEPEIMPHLQLQEIEGQETLRGDMLRSNSIIESRYALPSFTWQESTALERRQVGESVVSIGGIGVVGSSKGEMYAAIRQTRATGAMEEKLGNLLDRFFNKVDESGDCHLWTGAKDPSGRGQFRISSTIWGAHRLAYALYFGEAPPSALIQSCGNLDCVRPEHLRTEVTEIAA